MNWKAVLLTAAAAVTAQAQSPKVCLINLEQAMVSTVDGQNAEQKLNAEFGPRKAALEAKQKDASALQDKIDKGGMTDIERQKLVDQLDDKTNEIDRETTQADADLQLAQRSVLKELAPKMINFVVRYLHQKGCEMVFDISSTDLPRLYEEGAPDITEDAVKAYDQSTGAKPSTTPPPKKK